MPKVKHEAQSPAAEPDEMAVEIEADEKFELDFVEQYNGDDVEAEEDHQMVHSSQNSLSAPHSPDGDVGEEGLLNPGEDEEDDLKKHINPKDELGPKTPPEVESQKTFITKAVSRGIKRQHSSKTRSRSQSSNSSHSGSRRSPPSSYRERGSRRSRDEELTVEERIQQNKETRLIRLREARSRRQAYEYVPPPSKSRAFPSQPYFKNPSFYPQEQRDKSKPLAPPPAQKIQPLPGGRLPLVQRRSTPPPPFERAAHSPPPPVRRRRTIVEETIRVTTARRSSPRRSRSPSSYRRGSGSSSSSKELGPQTLYPSRRNPYPPPSHSSRGNDDDNHYNGQHASSSSSYRDSGGYSSSHSNGSNNYIFTGKKYVPRPFIPPPPPGKQWNCPKREESYGGAPMEKKKWRRCPQRET